MKTSGSDDSQRKNKKKSSIFSKTLTCFACIIIAIAVILMVRALVFHKYDVFGYTLNIIRSGSMRPTIEVLDIVVTKPEKEYKEGDIVSYTDKGNTIVHRIVRIYDEDGKRFYTTRGDANNGDDQLKVKDENINGKVVYIIPKVGNVAIFVQRNLPIILIFIVGIFLIITLVRRLI